MPAVGRPAGPLWFAPAHPVDLDGRDGEYDAMIGDVAYCRVRHVDIAMEGTVNQEIVGVHFLDPSHIDDV
ncbi:MAG: hypothetical protein AVDCRST_MAG88-1431 [uncultured Thermomicrobiales bacterium]|uniref:Uncharacterized protein n=1 Tax=uncultured Thermomicrobiales bacterium TaxID=1645740 RepID=A0A6J4UY79_9BACT|nr:MAG: hypothetical protein AVDCRST_MAG88-1431 [uncultured Thermomicrobiales bacterium]